MNAHEKALVASISKLRGAGYMKPALDLENELRRLRASSPVAKPKIAKTKPAPPPVDDDDDTPDPDDETDDEPEDAAPAKPKKKTKHVEALRPHTRGGSSMTLVDHGGPGEGVVTIDALVAAARRLTK